MKNVCSIRWIPVLPLHSHNYVQLVLECKYLSQRGDTPPFLLTYDTHILDMNKWMQNQPLPTLHHFQLPVITKGINLVEGKRFTQTKHNYTYDTSISTTSTFSDCIKESHKLRHLIMWQVFGHQISKHRSCVFIAMVAWTLRRHWAVEIQ